MRRNAPPRSARKAQKRYTRMLGKSNRSVTRFLRRSTPRNARLSDHAFNASIGARNRVAHSGAKRMTRSGMRHRNSTKRERAYISGGKRRMRAS